MDAGRRETGVEDRCKRPWPRNKSEKKLVNNSTTREMRKEFVEKFPRRILHALRLFDRRDLESQGES